jgi:hypothetical protein
LQIRSLLRKRRIFFFSFLASTHHTESDPIARGFHQNKTQQKKNFDRIPISSIKPTKPTKQKPLMSTAIAKTKIHQKNQKNKAKKDSPTLTPRPEIYDPKRRHSGGKEEGGKKKPQEEEEEEEEEGGGLFLYQFVLFRRQCCRGDDEKKAN